MSSFRYATPSMSTTDWLLLVFLSVLWGGSFYFAKIAVPEIPPLTLALGRVGIAAAVLAAVARLMVGPFPRNPAIWLQLAFMAALNKPSRSCCCSGARSASRSGLLRSSTPPRRCSASSWRIF